VDPLTPDLVKIWIYETGDEALRPSGFQLGVFSSGYFQHQLVSKDTPLGQKVAVPSKLLFELFQKWQMKLALTEIHRVTDVRTLPLPLFDFPEKEDICYWRVPVEGSPGADA
jgi:hypothetical protein